MNHSIAIYDKDIQYSNQLMDYIKRMKKRLTQTRVFTNQNSLMEYLENNRIHILLLHESLIQEELNQEQIDHICILSEENDKHINRIDPIIYKYQSAEIIMQEIFTFYPMETGKEKVHTSEKSRVSIISVFSINEEISRGAFALSLAQEYAKLKRTLYINLDVFQALPELSGQNKEMGLSEFIYYLKQNSPNLSNKIINIIMKRKALDYIPGVSFAPDLYELKTQDLVLWLKVLREEMNYDIIVFDVGCLHQAVIELFFQSSEIFLLSKDSACSKLKCDNLKNQLIFAGYEEVMEKMTLINLTQEKEQRYEKYLEDNLISFTEDDLASDYINIKL